jgi:UPF0755 protein
MWRHVAANALTFLIVALFLLGGLVAWGVRQYSAAGPLASPVCLDVEGGSTMREVSEDLARQGAITSPEVFRIGADYAEKSSLLKEGRFLIPANASMSEIVDVVTRGGASTCGTEVVVRVGVSRTVADVSGFDPDSGAYAELASFDLGADSPPAAFEEAGAEPDATWRVVVVEGTTAWQVVEALNAIPVLEGPVEELPPEGSLAPREYPVTPGSTVQSLLDQMQDAQAETLATAWESRAANLPISTPEEALVLASIVEKETAVAEERARVASVFVNRLREGMRLQTDPAVIYGVTEGRGPLGRGLRQSELDAPTPYNTYVIDGLPPTPIANPGEAAIRAALNPDGTDYLYFVADGTGGHAFATTYDDHQRNVARWREVEAQRAAEAEAAAAAASVAPAVPDGGDVEEAANPDAAEAAPEAALGDAPAPAATD